MTANLSEFRVRGQSADQALWTLRPPGAAQLVPPLMKQNWTTVHTAVARFMGECLVVGASLGVVTEVARALREQRHG